jgi:hypothetical protein
MKTAMSTTVAGIWWTRPIHGVYDYLVILPGFGIKKEGADE